MLQSSFARWKANGQTSWLALASWLPTLSRWVLGGLAVLYIALYLFIALSRMAYPFELEWMEGSMLVSVTRILEGEALYEPPSLAFVPYIYTPLYFYLSAAVATITGVGFLPLRLVSFVSSLGLFGLIYRLVQRETGQHFPALIAVGLFAATYRISGAWFDLARIDSFYLLLLFAALYVVRWGDSDRAAVLAGVLFALCFLTKQSALFVAAPLGLLYMVEDRRQALLFGATLGGLIAGSTLLLDSWYEGWYRYFVFALPARQGIVLSRLIDFWKADVLGYLGLLIPFVPIFVVDGIFTGRRRSWLFYTLVTLGLVGSAYQARIHAGGYTNTLIPAYAAIAILFALALHTLFGYAQRLSSRQRVMAECYLCGVGMLQFMALVYMPFSQIPTAADVAAGHQLLARIAQVEGEVFLPAHGYLATRVGKQAYVHQVAYEDLVVSGGPSPEGAQLEAALLAALQAQQFDAVIIDEGWFYLDALEASYIRAEEVIPNAVIFRPVTGFGGAPRFLYLPKSR